MIPEFPTFKKLEFADKKDIEKLTFKFPPYSDFNFFSMWSWDIRGNMMISHLNKNLVVLFNDYVSGDKFLSFIGSNKITETALELISFSKKKYSKNFLKLIPEEAFLHLKNSGFIIKTERDSFDYIYLVEHLANMKSWSQNSSGKKIRKLLKTGHNFVVKHSRLQEIKTEEYKEMFCKWAKSKNIDEHFKLNEYKAFERILEVPNKSLRLVSIYEDTTMVGFTLYEIISKDYAISHFAKADISHHSAIYDLLNWEEAKYLHSLGVKYFNWEQDLGISTLRYSKLKYKPAFFLRKLQIEPSGVNKFE